jgi:hypothetical protein
LETELETGVRYRLLDKIRDNTITEENTENGWRKTANGRSHFVTRLQQNTQVDHVKDGN